MWDRWEEFWKKALKIKPSNGGKRYVVHLGDATDRPGQHESVEFITSNRAVIASTALAILKDKMQSCDYRFMIAGTAVHVGQSAEDEDVLAEGLECVPDTSTGRRFWYELELEVQDVRFHCAHQAPITSKPYLKGNTANAVAFDVLYGYLSTDRKPPEYALRGHAHIHSDSGSNYPTRAIIAPAWQLRTGYVARKAPVARADIGGMIFVIENGETKVMVERYGPERRGPWSVQSLSKS
jgi:hypothetical protein